MLEQAKQLLKTGDITKAHALLEKTIELDDTNIEAKGILAKLVFNTDIDRAAQLASEIYMGNPGDLEAQAIQELHRILKNKDDIAKSSENGGHPKAWQAYLAGIEAAARKDYDTAITRWIEALVIDRSIDDDGPRRACVAIFNLLGQHHELTQKHHRSFSSALF
jgi:putative thioredoxin